MAEYVEVNKQFKRMCSIYQSKRCSGCPMQSVNISQCRRKAFESPGEFEITVMRWAKQNPEKIYPTWLEYLHSQIKSLHGMSDHEAIYTLCMYRVPDAIAEELGIQPINVKAQNEHEMETGRDPNRIYAFCDMLRRIWEQCPDMRFGQLISNVFAGMCRDPFYIEDDEMIKLIDATVERQGKP